MKSIILLTCVAFLGLTFTSGCRKKKDTTAKIIVRDANNALVIGATVHIYAESTLDYPPTINAASDQTGTTDYKGEAFFSYNDIYQLGQAGVAVLNIDCTKAAATGSGIIKIEAEVENSETVYIAQ